MAEVLHTNLGNIVYIYEILKKHSDSEHILRCSKISELVKEEFGEKIEERTIRRNIRVLREKLDIDISTYSENGIGYYLTNKEFEFSEVKMLIDLLKTSKFLEKSFSKDIVERLKTLLNKYELEVFEKAENIEIYSKNTKTINKEVLNNIEVLQNNINNKKKIVFDYYKYDLDKKLRQCNPCKVSPYCILCENEFYYLIAHNERYNDYSYFRLDRIKNIKELKDTIVKPKQSLKEYIESSVYMFGGEKTEVTLICNIKILDDVLDKFGKNIEIKKIDENRFKAYLDVNTRGLKMWIMQYLKYVEIENSYELKSEIYSELKENMQKFKT